jgi:hypothetical protein
MNAEPWPFDQAPNCAVISLRSVVFGGAPILHVTHDADDHGWQFLGLQDANTAEAAVVSLREIVALDPTVCSVSDLPPGWHAWRQSTSAMAKGLCRWRKSPSGLRGDSRGAILHSHAPGGKDWIRTRMEDILEERNPTPPV